MFLRKEKAKTEGIDHTSTDQRDSFRYDFKAGQGIKIKFKETHLELINISAGGVGFANQGFETLDFGYINFTLNIPQSHTKQISFFAGLRILKIDEENVCHGIFEQCTLDQHELIHKYVLEMQKNDLAR